MSNSGAGSGDGRSTLKVDVVIKTDNGGRWIVQQVEEFKRRRFDVRVILPNGSGGPLGRELSSRGISVVSSPFDFRFRPTLRTVRGIRGLRKLMRDRSPHVVMYHLYASTLASRIATLGLKTKRVQMVAGPLFLESPAIRLAERLISRIDHVIINGCADARNRYAALGYPDERLAVVSYGVDTEHYSPAAASIQPSLPAQASHAEHRIKDTEESVRSSLDIGNDTFLAIMVAYVYGPKGLVHKGVGIKGHHVLLHAWKQFTDQRPNSHLLLVGGGHGQAGEKYRGHLLKKFDVAAWNNVTWLNSADDVRPYYLAANVSVSPSLSEGHGAALEASSMGVPNIVSDAGGLPETVTQLSGWIVRRGDTGALTRALEQAHEEWTSGEINSRKAESRKLAVQRFDRKITARSVADIVEEQGRQLLRQAGLVDCDRR